MYAYSRYQYNCLAAGACGFLARAAIATGCCASVASDALVLAPPPLLPATQNENGAAPLVGVRCLGRRRGVPGACFGLGARAKGSRRRFNAFERAAAHDATLIGMPCVRGRVWWRRSGLPCDILRNPSLAERVPLARSASPGRVAGVGRPLKICSATRQCHPDVRERRLFGVRRSLIGPKLCNPGI